MPEPWLLITLSTGGPSSTLRVHAWRKLRSLGALALAQSAYLVPERPATVRAINRLVARVRREGSGARLLHLTLQDQEEREMIAAFSAERAGEYGEIAERTGEFLAEIEMERGRGRATYTEVEESDTDLKRFRSWLDAVRKRDYFDAAGRAEAEDAVDACERALAEFEAEAFAGELAATGQDAVEGGD